MNFRFTLPLFAGCVLFAMAEPDVMPPLPPGLPPTSRTVSAAPAHPAVPVAWLGMNLVKPEESISVHLPTLPPGIGFVIQAVSPAGPADAAGIRALDVVWKFNDQLLVNEAQLAALLRLSRPGEQVSIAVFRAGQPLEVKLVLGDTPKAESRFPGELIDSAILPVEGSPMRVVNISERTATFSDGEGKAVLTSEGDSSRVIISDASGKAVYEGTAAKGAEFAGMPAAWQRRVCALRRGLDHAIGGRFVPVRPPRQRVVPATVPGS